MIDGYLIVYERDGHSHIREEHLETMLAALRRSVPNADRPWADAEDERDTLLELVTTAGEPYFVRASAISSMRHTTAASRALAARIETELQQRDRAEREAAAAGGETRPAETA